MSNKYLLKIAELSEGQKDLAGTGALALLGGVGTLATDAAHSKLIPHMPTKFSVGKLGKATKFGIGGAIGLGLDYAGVRAMKKINEPKQ